MPNIIIVEDDPMISEIYQKKFTDAGFQVETAESGEQVLAMAKKGKVDVILSDLMMPKINGFDVVKALRGGGYDEHIKIIIFSNLSQKEDREKAFKLGADGFITKSEFTPSALVEEVKRLLSQFGEEDKNKAIQNGNSEILKKNGGKNILLIEDEDVFIDMFGEKLRQDGYEVETADNGAWGLKEAMAKNFDLIIVDMMMPAMTGDEIIEKLKMEDQTKNIPIIVLSASVDDEVKRKVLEMGANAFFVKTQIIPSQLSREVEELLENKLNTD
jgi:DNA-binding response OmpR family regulator